MRKAGFITVVTVLCLAVFSFAASAEEITADELRKVIDSQPYINLFDVRSTDEYEKGTIPGASSFPLDGLKDAVRKILDNGFSAMSVDVYVYGGTEEESIKAAEIMTGLGFTNVHYLSDVGSWPDILVTPRAILGDMKTTDLNGQPVDASMIAGSRLVMVNVWATYCGPCINEMQGLGNLARELKDQGIRVIGLLSDCTNSDLSVNATLAKKARSIVESTQADYPHILPSAIMIRNVITQIQAVPTTFFLDENGIMVGEVYVGARDDQAWHEIVMKTLEGLE